MVDARSQRAASARVKRLRRTMMSARSATE